MTVAQLIRAVRTARSLSQEAFAGRAGVNHATVSRWESGASVPGSETLLMLSRDLVFDVTIHRGRLTLVIGDEST